MTDLSFMRRLAMSVCFFVGHKREIVLIPRQKVSGKWGDAVVYWCPRCGDEDNHPGNQHRHRQPSYYIVDSRSLPQRIINYFRRLRMRKQNRKDLPGIGSTIQARSNINRKGPS